MIARILILFMAFLAGSFASKPARNARTLL